MELTLVNWGVTTAEALDKNPGSAGCGMDRDGFAEKHHEGRNSRAIIYYSLVYLYTMRRKASFSCHL
jgi:hypothetical protein